jgi:hypothetical protein
LRRSPPSSDTRKATGVTKLDGYDGSDLWRGHSIMTASIMVAGTTALPMDKAGSAGTADSPGVLESAGVAAAVTGKRRGVAAMTSRAAIRADIHERFVAVVARVEAKLDSEQKVMERKHAAALARERKEARLARRPGGERRKRESEIEFHRPETLLVNDMTHVGSV